MSFNNYSEQEEGTAESSGFSKMMKANRSNPVFSARAGALRVYEDAKRELESIRRQSENAMTAVPTHRELINEVIAGGFRPSRVRGDEAGRSAACVIP